MFERKIYRKMIEWKRSLVSKKTALVIRGARQVGKTTIVNEFANSNYENVVYINFMLDSDIKEVFDGSLDVDKIIKGISYNKSGVKFIPNKTVIIFDEIQECARARSSIKSFCLDGRFDIIATGSLLGIRGYNRKSDASIPVGFETFLNMKAMDFEEFLLSNGFSQDQIDYLRNKVIDIRPIENSIHNKMLSLLKEYICIGGMPSVVDDYLKNKNFNSAREIQLNIIEAYKDDFGKHLNKNEQPTISELELSKTLKVFNSIPNQLAKECSKFKFSDVSENAKYRDYINNIQWLEDAGIISLCYRVENLQRPLKGYQTDNWFKIYMQDTGLFISQLGNSIATSIFNDDIGMYKGYIYENIVADALIKKGYSLHYYAKDGYEIDFVLSLDTNIYPIEVKSKNNPSASLKKVLKEKKYEEVRWAIKLSRNNIGFMNNVLSIPYYLAFLIDDDLIANIIKKNRI